MKRAFAEINLAKLADNLRHYRAGLRPAVSVMGIVKADAYGHGAVPVARRLLREGVNYFGVAWLSEAAELRQNGIAASVLVLSQPDPRYIAEIIGLKVVQAVYDYDFAARLSQAAEQKVRVHIKIDTGMNRIGVKPDGLADLLKKIKDLKNIKAEGLFTHLACLDDSGRRQLKLFAECAALARDILPEIKCIHALNSGGTLAFPEAEHDIVRLGIGLYRGVLTLKSRVMTVKTIRAGEAVSYGAAFVADRPTRLATISIGYADGLSRLLSNKGRVLIRGGRYALCGNICMDMCMAIVDEQVEAGDEVVIIGRQGAEEITAQELADLTGTIDYEIMCGIGKRVPREFKE
ncbi:MAG: alanine racemase [Candidatus Margulisbacteria bacterium]|jgi:alanine racemase|nr:alanine racemase [Candidatus Margulisiibacteriota bacterium]